MIGLSQISKLNKVGQVLAQSDVWLETACPTVGDPDWCSSVYSFPCPPMSF